MSVAAFLILLALFLLTSVVGVVTGSNSLITVPAMFELGIDERTAIATNMFGLTLMSVGGAIPFLRKGTVNIRGILPMILLTVVGSAIGAAIVGLITNETIKLIVTIAMIAIVAFTIVKPNRPAPESKIGENEGVLIEDRDRPSVEGISYLGYSIVFLLAIYGGLYSGGYVTVLTPVLVAFFGFSFAGSIAATKVINIFSSLIATVVFIYQGLVDLKLGIILGLTMFIGAFAGAHFATKMNERSLRIIFYSAVLLLALKMLFDLIAGR